MVDPIGGFDRATAVFQVFARGTSPHNGHLGAVAGAHTGVPVLLLHLTHQQQSLIRDSRRIHEVD